MQKEVGEKTKPAILVGARMCEGEEQWGLSQALGRPRATGTVQLPLHTVMSEHRGIVARAPDFKREAEDSQL